MKTTIYPLNQYTDFDSAYWGMGNASDGKLYFGLCTHLPGKNAGLFSFDPKTEGIVKVLDLGVLEANQSHGKIHTPIIEGDDEILYFGTHSAYPYGEPQDISYEGGHFLGYDINTKSIIDFGIASPNEGILTIALDAQRATAYLLTVPSGYLIKCDIKNRTYTQLGRIPSKGSICRTITLDKSGKLYGSYEDNGLFIYDVSQDKLELLDNFFPDEHTLEWNSSSRRGANKIGRKLWRCITYDLEQDALYGILASSSQILRIDCSNRRLDLFPPLIPDRYSPAQDIYPTLSLVSIKDTLLYAPADGLFDYSHSEKIKSLTHLMAFNKKTRSQLDLGTIKDQTGTKVYGVAGAITHNASIYLLGATEKSEDGIKPEQLFQLQGKPFNLSLIKITLDTIN